MENNEYKVHYISIYISTLYITYICCVLYILFI